MTLSTPSHYSHGEYSILCLYILFFLNSLKTAVQVANILQDLHMMADVEFDKRVNLCAFM